VVVEDDDDDDDGDKDEQDGTPKPKKSTPQITAQFRNIFKESKKEQDAMQAEVGSLKESLVKVQGDVDGMKSNVSDIKNLLLQMMQSNNNNRT
jgi:hypothetical protein